MTFYELVDQAIALLRERGRLSYRALKRQFHLDDARLDDLKFELIEVQGVARDQGGAILVLTGTLEPAAARPRPHSGFRNRCPWPRPRVTQKPSGGN